MISVGVIVGPLPEGSRASAGHLPSGNKHRLEQQLNRWNHQHMRKYLIPSWEQIWAERDAGFKEDQATGKFVDENTRQRLTVELPAVSKTGREPVRPVPKHGITWQCSQQKDQGSETLRCFASDPWTWSGRGGNRNHTKIGLPPVSWSGLWDHELLSTAGTGP